MQNPCGACGATLICGAVAFAMLAPAKAAETTPTAASAILLSMVSLCGFVFAVRGPTRRVRHVRRFRREQPAHHGGNTCFQRLSAVDLRNSAFGYETVCERALSLIRALKRP